MKINPQFSYQISEMLNDHLKNYDHSLTIKSRDFIYNNINDDFIYEGDAFRLFLFENEYLVDKDINSNCSWSSSIEGIKEYYSSFNGDWYPRIECSQLWIADIIGIEVNPLIQYMNKNLGTSISENYLKEKEILALSICNWELLDIDHLKNNVSLVY